MKIRVAQIMFTNGRHLYFVQRRVWGVWQDMYFDAEQRVLKEEKELGNGSITDAAFAARKDAIRYAKDFKNPVKRIIHKTWKV
jgi:hypothetical protein